MLQALAAKGQLQVTVEHGRLVYALWERDAPHKGVGLQVKTTWGVESEGDYHVWTHYPAKRGAD
jgi:hypothetical protein